MFAQHDVEAFPRRSGLEIAWKAAGPRQQYVNDLVLDDDKKKPIDATRSAGEASGARGDGEDLSYKDQLAHPSPSLALRYRAGARKMSPVDEFYISR